MPAQLSHQFEKSCRGIPTAHSHGLVGRGRRDLVDMAPGEFGQELLIVLLVCYPHHDLELLQLHVGMIVVFAEEMKGIDITTVTFFHVTRVIMVVFLVPLLIFSPIFAAKSSNSSSGIVDNVIPQWSDLFPLIFLFALICFLAARLGTIIKLPAPYFLGPVIVVAALGLSGLQGPPLPPSLLDISQFMVGGYIGLLLKPAQLDNKKKIILLALMNGLILICATMFFSFLLTQYYDLSSITGFLSLAPGGMDQMGIIAQEVNTDVSTVTSYQLFRMAFIYIVVPPLLRLVLKLSLRKKDKDNNSVKLHAK
jgi:membrane AbrB-like protein